MLQIERVVDDINRAFVTLPECVRYHCVKTNAKCLSAEPQHKVSHSSQIFRVIFFSYSFEKLPTGPTYLFFFFSFQEIMKNFEEGVINVLVVSSLVEEAMDVKSSLLISLEPNKAIFKLADARFIEGPEKCLFILTRGNESTVCELPSLTYVYTTA